MDLEKHPQQPVAPAEPAGIRASDADRDRIADILREAMAEGRLTAEEHAERVDAVYRAKTVGELEPLVRDLPDPSGASRPAAAADVHGQASPTGPAENLVAIFSSSTRKGRWRVGGRTNAFALFGSVEIDLTEALFGQRLTVVNATSIFGSVEIKVPENISLRGSGTGVFGNFEVATLESADPEAPVVVVNGYSVFGSVEAKPKRGKFIADLQNRLRKYFDQG
ncbi:MULTISPECIES: DUF1707 SHOCT-like domain-containing protein [unclassified Streptomyces]|uniref:DUF1707 SHOCT-like domain-containing protein n=2 Tax=Streptomyces TaxID=1883 RepID=UPI00225B8C33|nr:MULTISPECIES: DUF1707 domain-containing protein [unclassified Streptomyces]WSP57252.1 DUF1707 domain-containing protein [Streptomyces sp. NBC_01241]WSU22030.1 DUF1707 domain-containing protein [Streptomyces sp. NBC_01108]MCX4789067.1 DUF1707 domain-containing protein [Streptomyces sp. NBC_01221]MCX4795187.1 DUF1707 domain-containing protein [Streptomyces sp. NBC_01242]WSJ36503.1 DUF1707 domain-containing protein [Streptomyces sp. NBC_01321]